MRLFKPLPSSDPAIILTGFMALVTWKTKRMASDESDWVVHTYSVMGVMGALDATLLHLVEVTDTARAFALTGQDDLLAHHESAKVAGYHPGANSFIQKPVDFDQFRAI